MVLSKLLLFRRAHQVCEQSTELCFDGWLRLRCLHWRLWSLKFGFDFLLSDGWEMIHIADHEYGNVIVVIPTDLAIAVDIALAGCECFVNVLCRGDRFLSGFWHVRVDRADVAEEVGIIITVIVIIVMIIIRAIVSIIIIIIIIIAIIVVDAVAPRG